jgi:hypothetical protein
MRIWRRLRRAPTRRSSGPRISDPVILPPLVILPLFILPLFILPLVLSFWSDIAAVRRRGATLFNAAALC